VGATGVDCAGATSGIGQAVAVRLARDGKQIVVGRGAAVVEQIQAAGGEASLCHRRRSHCHLTIISVNLPNDSS
jgi:NAD(P)-dependent dehydrogenase (short-subunit alcohol dehydrogenase family)